MGLPSARGEISGWLFDALGRSPDEPVPARPPIARTCSLDDEDLQLALYCCYELHYGGLPGVSDRWEWSLVLLQARAEMEAAFERALFDLVGAPLDGAPADEMDLALRAIADADDGPSLSSYVERTAGVEQVGEFMIHRSAYQLKEADPHSWALPRLSGPPKAALVEIQADEYGGGVPTGCTRRCSPGRWRLWGSTQRRAPTSTRSPRRRWRR